MVLPTSSSSEIPQDLEGDLEDAPYISGLGTQPKRASSDAQLSVIENAKLIARDGGRCLITNVCTPDNTVECVHIIGKKESDGEVLRFIDLCLIVKMTNTL